jgi:hypothetical protein
LGMRTDPRPKTLDNLTWRSGKLAPRSSQLWRLLRRFAKIV